MNRERALAEAAAVVAEELRESRKLTPIEAARRAWSPGRPPVEVMAQQIEAARRGGTASAPVTSLIEHGVTFREEPTSIDGAVRYWMVLEFDSPSNSTLLRDVLRVSRNRARDLWAGRTDYTGDELEHLCAVLRKPVGALTDMDGYLDDQRRKRKVTRGVDADATAYRDYIAAACALADAIEFEDRITTDPTVPADGSSSAAKLRADARQREIGTYRAAKEAFLQAVTTK